MKLNNSPFMTSPPMMTRPTLHTLVTLTLLVGWWSELETGLAAEAPAGFPALGDLPVQAGLPDPLSGADGQAITTAAQWAAQRERMKAIIQHYLQTQPFADPAKIIAVGHSRLGKATLIAGAFDERFALTAPAGSGCGGTGAYRFNGGTRGGKEGLEDAIKNFPQWFGPRMSGFCNQVEKLPFDQHWLLALVAPRLCIPADGLSDGCTNGNALAKAYLGAKPVYDLLDVPDHLGIAFRAGGHLLAAEDWDAILDFADLHLRQRTITRPFDQLPAAKKKSVVKDVR